MPVQTHSMTRSIQQPQSQQQQSKPLQSIRRIITTIFGNKKSSIANQEVRPEPRKVYLYDYSDYYSEDQIRILSSTIYANASTLKDRKPTYDEIDELLVACNYYLENDLDIYRQLIMSCPYEFMLTYSNNSERTPGILNYVKTFDVELAKYIFKFTNCVNKNTWGERYNEFRVD